MAAKDIERHQFKKGQTGNPNGRPKLPNLKEAMAKILADEKEGTSALEAILAAMRAKAAKGDVRAAEFLIDRGYGKPEQAVSYKQDGAAEITIRVIEGNDNDQQP